VASFLKAEILDEASTWTPGAGVPQGAVLGPRLSPISLDPLNHRMAAEGFETVRPADDFVILCRTADKASRTMELVRLWAIDNGLTLHPTKTKIVDAGSDSFGECLSRIIADVHPTLAGWVGDFQHSRRWIIHRLDAWLGGQLQSILRNRTQRRGRGRGRDHHRRPNSVRVEHGLFSLANAHRLACPSSRT
jgi:RNA-directed DNA polymerase